ncbi:MAG TPA: hypothetical protein VNZ55_12560 [Thermomicrobiales bacterium]|nr:hypothetical protein [Thermomicrobiales bacterium]
MKRAIHWMSWPHGPSSGGASRQVPVARTGFVTGGAIAMPP